MRRIIAPSLLALFMATACATPAEEPAEAASASPSATPSPSPSPEPEPEGALVDAGINIGCDARGGGRIRVLDWDDVWRPVPRALIDTCAIRNPPRANDLEAEAAEVAGYTGTRSFTDLYLFCLRDLSEHEITTEAEAQEVAGALTICPEHPDAAHLAESAESYLDDPPAPPISTGVHIVGEDIEPGTYVTERSDGKAFSACYWERTDADGGIIDNHFSGSATRVQVTIHASDHSFHSDGCGTWEKR